MDPDRLKSNLKNYIPVSDEQVQFLLGLMDEVSIKKRDYLLRSGSLCHYFCLVDEGVLMNYYTDENGVDHVLQFAAPMWWTADLYSLTHGTVSSYSIRAVTDSKLLRISRSGLEELYDAQPIFERYFRIIFQNALMAHQRRIIQNIAYTAEERYLNFIDDYPDLEQIIPQKYIASYLGISAEFLSKIRKSVNR